MSEIEQLRSDLKAAREGLEAEKSNHFVALEWKLELECLRVKYEQSRQESAKLREECDGLRKDAERYRWLRVRILNKYPEVMMLMVSEDEKAPSELDAAIDAALSPKNPT